MPYIREKDRGSVEQKGARLAGELNYLFTCEIIQFLRDRPLSYALINDVLGALEGAKLEFVRRIVNPYEDKKIEENGDVYNV
jgi:hypothetical protein